MHWDTVIGLEVHARLTTRSKLFSGASTAFGAAANTQTALIDAGLPGVLPVVNQRAIHLAIQFGLAIEAEINNLSYFERKNYFYADLPKGYQISQFERPIVSNGHLTIQLPDKGEKKIEIARAHLEEDAGKSMHDAFPKHSGIDLNRAGTALLEIVTTPCMYSAQEAVLYLKTLHQLLRFMNICDGNMQEGSFRCDVNISLKPAGSKVLGVRTELKNLNSFRFIEKAIFYEQERHQDLLEQGKTIRQETRHFCPEKEITYSLRSKENEQDYRYFPDPDLLPILIDEAQLQSIRTHLPGTPQQIQQRLSQEQLSDDDIAFLLQSPETYHFFQSIQSQTSASAKLIVNWLRNTYNSALQEQGKDFDFELVPAATLAGLLDALHHKKINTNAARQIFTQLCQHKANLDTLLAQHTEQSLDDPTLLTYIEQLLQDHPQQVQEYQQGKEKLFAFFVGQVMKFSKGRANPDTVTTLLNKCLKK